MSFFMSYACTARLKAADPRNSRTCTSLTAINPPKAPLQQKQVWSSSESLQEQGLSIEGQSSSFDTDC